MKIYVPLLLLIVNTICVFSQNAITEDEHNKYWYYKKDKLGICKRGV